MLSKFLGVTNDNYFISYFEMINDLWSPETRMYIIKIFLKNIIKIVHENLSRLKVK